jgi:hypothetical protein
MAHLVEIMKSVVALGWKKASVHDLSITVVDATTGNLLLQT